jgi:serine/threonine protein kinase
MHRDLKLANILVNFPGMDNGHAKNGNLVEEALIMK